MAPAGARAKSTGTGPVLVDFTLVAPPTKSTRKTLVLVGVVCSPRGGAGQIYENGARSRRFHPCSAAHQLYENDFGSRRRGL